MSVKSVMSQDAVGMLYTAHHTWLRGWLDRRLNNSSDASDLTQDTFVRLLGPQSAVQLQNEVLLNEPRAYLATIAKRLLLNHFRRQSVEQAYLDALAGMPEQLIPSPEQKVLLLEALQEIDAMLDMMPAKVRTVFMMAQIDDMPYADIAATLGIGLRSVKRYMAQAMAECIMFMQ
jgi:RNA polymerase sigma factor (sigma-70 family)